MFYEGRKYLKNKRPNLIYFYVVYFKASGVWQTYKTNELHTAHGLKINKSENRVFFYPVSLWTYQLDSILT